MRHPLRLLPLVLALLAGAPRASAQGAPPPDSSAKADSVDRSPRNSRVFDPPHLWTDTTGLSGWIIKPVTRRERSCLGRYHRGSPIMAGLGGAFGGGVIFAGLWYFSDHSLKQRDMIQQGAVIGAAGGLYTAIAKGYWVWECEKLG